MGLNKFQQNANLNNLEKKIIYITKKESIRYKYYIKTKDNGCEMDAQKIYNIYYNFLIKQNFFKPLVLRQIIFSRQRQNF